MSFHEKLHAQHHQKSCAITKPKRQAFYFAVFFFSFFFENPNQSPLSLSCGKRLNYLYFIISLTNPFRRRRRRRRLLLCVFSFTTTTFTFLGSWMSTFVPLGWLPHYWLVVAVVDFVVVASSAVAAAAAHTDATAIVAVVAVVFVEIAVAGFAFYFVVVVATSLFYFSTNNNRKKIKIKTKKDPLFISLSLFCSNNNSFLNIHNQLIIHFYSLFY